MHPGQRIGKYVLGDRIAVGGMAEVWAAHAEGPEGFIKPVALKFILESFSGDPELEQLFVKEARIAAQLQHANLVAVFDFDKVIIDPLSSAPARYYIAMEHVEGHDARRVAEAAKHAGYVFPVPVALYLAGEVLKGLRYVHERREKGRLLGLVHRDVSPHNVLVGFSGEVKLSDFGIAKSLAHSTRTKTGTVRGKLSYASPEQLNGESVDHRTDQFAMGITLWELLAGRPLFDGNDEVEIAGKVMRCDIPSLGLISPERKIPPAVEGFVRRMLAPRRDERFSTTADALSALLALPAYSGDGVGLGELVRTLFHRASVGPAPTLSLPDPARPAPAQRAGGAAGAARGGPQPLPSEVETRTMARAPAAREPARPPAPAAGRDLTTVRVRGGQGQGRSRAAIAALAAAGGLALIAIAAGAAYLSSGHAADPPIASGPGESEPVPPSPPTTPADTVSDPAPQLPSPSPVSPSVAPLVPARKEQAASAVAAEPPPSSAAPRLVAGAPRVVVPIVTVPAAPAAPARAEPTSTSSAPAPAAAETPPPAPPAAPAPPQGAGKPGTPANGAPIVE